MSSSEPRLTKPTAGQLSAAQANRLTTDPHPDGPLTTNAQTVDSLTVNPLKSTVPLATHVLLVGVMLLFFLAATLITLQARWQWWLIPALVAVPVISVLTQRAKRVSRAREARRQLELQLRSSGSAR